MNLVIATIIITYANGFPAPLREEFRAPTEEQAMQKCTAYAQAVIDRFAVRIGGEKQIGGSFVCVPKATK